MSRLLILLAWLLGAAPTAAAAPQAWVGLPPGPHAVGYRGNWEMDSSRTYFPEATFEGRRLEGDRRRPVAVRIWYPAQRTAARPLTYGDYRNLPAATPRLRALAQDWDAANKGIHDYAVRKFTGSPEMLARLFASRMLAVKDAPPLPGRFPVVVYAGGANFSLDENPVLWEHLASHGYVVVTVPTQGPRTVNFSADAPGLEVLTRDLECALGLARQLPFADQDRIAATGFSFGGLAALLAASRNTDIDAVVGFDSSITSTSYSRPLLANPTWAVGRVAMPLLEFHAAGPNLTRSVLDELRYADRRSFELPGLDHVDFINYPVAFHALGGVSPKGLPISVRAGWYQAMARRTLDFLDAVLKGDRAAAGRLDAHLTAPLAEPVRVVRAAAIARAPSALELADLFVARGPAAAGAVLDEVAQRDPKAPLLESETLNRLGYLLLDRRAPPSALRVFAWNARRHPESPRLLDSLADGFAAAGNPACAAAAYRRVLEVLAARPEADPADRVSLKAAAERRLAELPAPARGCAGLPA